MTAINFQKSTLKSSQLDSRTTYVGSPVDLASDLGIPTDPTNLVSSDLIPYTDGQLALLASSHARQIRYVVETNTLFYLTAHPSNPDARWKPLLTNGVSSSSPYFETEFFSRVITAGEQSNQTVIVHDSSLTPNILYPVFAAVLLPCQGLAQQVFVGQVWDEAWYINSGLLSGTIEVYVNGTYIPMVTQDLVASDGHAVHGWYPVVSGNDQAGRTYSLVFERIGYSGVNTPVEDDSSSSIPKLLCEGDHLQAFASYLKLG